MRCLAAVPATAARSSPAAPRPRWPRRVPTPAARVRVRLRFLFIVKLPQFVVTRGSFIALGQRYGLAFCLLVWLNDSIDDTDLAKLGANPT